MSSRWQGADHEYYKTEAGGQHFQLRKFWMDHQKALPLHFSAYQAQVAPLKAAAANVETVFSGAGKFTEEVNIR